MPLMDPVPKLRNLAKFTETTYSISDDLRGIIKIVDAATDYNNHSRVRHATDEMVTSAFIKVADRHRMSDVVGLKSLHDHARKTDHAVYEAHCLFDMQHLGEANLFPDGLFDRVRYPRYQRTYLHLINPENKLTMADEFLNGDIEGAYARFGKQLDRIFHVDLPIAALACALFYVGCEFFNTNEGWGVPVILVAYLAACSIGIRLSDRATVRTFTELQQRLAAAAIEYQSVEQTISPSCRTSGQFFCEVLDDLMLQKRGISRMMEPLAEISAAGATPALVPQSSSSFADLARTFSQQAAALGWAVNRVAGCSLDVEMVSEWQYDIYPPESLLRSFADRAYGEAKSSSFLGMGLADCLNIMQDEAQEHPFNNLLRGAGLAKPKRTMVYDARLAVDSAQKAVLQRATRSGGLEPDLNPACVGLFDIVWKNGPWWPSSDKQLLDMRPNSALLRRIYLFDIDYWALRMPEHVDTFNLSMQTIYGGLQGELERRMDIKPARFVLAQDRLTSLITEDLTRKALAQAAFQNINGIFLKPKIRSTGSHTKRTPHEFRVIPEKILMPLIVEIALIESTRKNGNGVLVTTQNQMASDNPWRTQDLLTVADLLGNSAKQSQCGEEVVGHILNELLHPLSISSTVEALLGLVKTPEELYATKKLLNKSASIQTILMRHYIEIPSQAEHHEKLSKVIELKIKEFSSEGSGPMRQSKMA